MRFRLLYSAALLFVVCMTLSVISSAQEVVSNQNPPMTLRAVLDYTYRHNPTLRAARAELRATDERLAQAYAGWQPTIISEAGVTTTDVEGSSFGNAEGSTAKNIGVSVSQPLFRGGSTFAEVAGARHVISAQQAALRSTEQDILLSAITAYADVLRDQRLLGLAENTRRIIARELEATRDRFEVGELTKTDVSQAEARLARADSDIITASGALNTSKGVFYQITGLMAEGLEVPELETILPDSLQGAVEQGHQTSPLVLYATELHEASEKDIDDVFGELLPSLSLNGSWNKTYDPSPGISPEETNKIIGLSASIPLYQAGAVRSRVRQAKHTANQRYIEIHEAHRQVEEQVVRSWSNWQAAEAEILSRQAQVKALEVAQEGVRAESEFGSRTVLDVLDADQEVFDAEVALAQAQRNEIAAKFGLLASIGLLSPETLGITGQTQQAQNYGIFDINVDRVPQVE